MVKINKKHLCPCGSGRKYKKCCFGKKPRKQSIMVGSPEPLKGFHYDKEKMTFMGITHDDRLIEPAVTYSQTHYNSKSGKEKVLSRIHDKVIPDQSDLLRHLTSSFDLIIASDTNTKVIENETISVTGIVHCVLRSTPDPGKYKASFIFEGAMPFRNCPSDLPSEKFGWITIIKNINHDPLNKSKRFAIVTDHDLDNHRSYNEKQLPIFKDIYLPDNFKLIYGRGDGSTDNLLNDLVKRCDKKATNVLKEIEQNQYYQYGDTRLSITQIPVPSL